METPAPGVWKLRLGTPERITPASLREHEPRLDALRRMPPLGRPPIAHEAVRFRHSARGLVIEIPIADADHVEQFLGLGLQLQCANHTGKRRTLRVNSDPVGDGDSHAPAPLVVSTAGYGIYVDAARYVTLYLGACRHVSSAPAVAPHATQQAATSAQELYAARAESGRILLIEVPAAQGVDLYFFGGPTALDAVRRYNLYSGGGCLPPMWGLGIWYRLYGRANQDQALALARAIRQAKLPCDVLGLEPGWQSHAYSCSFVWSRENFPDPDALLRQCRDLGYHVNLWEHVFVHPASPLYEPLKPYAGDFEVWSGLVPDLTLPPARRIFADHHRRTLVDRGVTGFKLDECDHCDSIRQAAWSFPESAAFPSGLDGEQMHCLLGLAYQRTIHEIFEKADTRTYSSVRSSGAFASPLPFVLYSDQYDHRDFVRGLVTCGVSGLLWSPEVRDAASREDFLRRIQSVVLSPQALINAWYCKNPPWLQFDRAANNADVLLEDADAMTAAVRKLFRLRMSLIPYLYAAFARYCFEGVPPFRSLALQYADDPRTHGIDDAYLMGDDLLVAPIFAGQTSRDVYLPHGDWYDLHTRTLHRGGQRHTFAVDPDRMLIFVRSGTLLPLAEPVEFVAPDTVFDLTIHAFGPAGLHRPTTLFEDDGVTFGFRQGAFNLMTIHPDQSVTRSGRYGRHRYRIVGWTKSR